MSYRERIRSVWRAMIKALAIYIASAWAVIEVIDFAVDRYGLNRLLLDSAVLIAFGGGMVTVVLAWFHGSPGSQKTRFSEVAIIATISVATIIAVTSLALRDPMTAFNALEGYRISFEFSSRGLEIEQYTFSTGPLETTRIFNSGMYHLEPDEGSVDGPGVKLRFKNHPVLLMTPADSEWMTVTFVLPFKPAELAEIGASGRVRDGLNFRTKNLSAIIESNVEIVDQASGTTFKVLN